MNQVSFVRATLLALVVLLCTSMAFAQSDLGSISGFVRDPSSAVVPKAQVTVKNEVTGTERVVNTNESGVYTVTSLGAGELHAAPEASATAKGPRTSQALLR